MTGCCQDPITTAYEIKNRVHAELGFTVNIGVSENKLLAKMASDFTKPDHVHTLWKSEMSEKMWHLPVGDLFYVGHASLYKLKKLGFSYDWRTGSYGSCNFARAYEVTGNTYLAICKWYR